LSQINQFESFYGFSLHGAKEGEKVRIAFRINCGNKRSEEERMMHIANILDNFAYPEIMRRIKDHRISSNYKLHSVDLVMYQNSNRNEILLNEEVRFLPNVKYKVNKPFKPGQLVMPEDIEEILGLYPEAINDPNAGHIMLTKFRENWYYACDLIYGLETSKQLCEKAEASIKSAHDNMNEMRWILVLDKLLHVCMFSTHAIQILQYDKNFSLKQCYQKNIDYLSIDAKNGNIDPKYTELYNRIFELRKKIKYLLSVSGKNKVKEEINKLVRLTSAFLDQVKHVVQSLTYSRMPALNYIKYQGTVTEKDCQKTKLISFGGIAAENAASNEKTVKLIFQLNSKDRFLEGVKSMIVYNILDNYAYPEVMKLVDSGFLPTDFKLRNVQLVMYADQSRNENLLNDKVRSVAHTKFKPGRKFGFRQPVPENDIEDILGLFPSESNDKNAAHVILTKWSGMWLCAFDLIYDRKRALNQLRLTL
jgi:uncharacterized protein (UPF0332 family)